MTVQTTDFRGSIKLGIQNFKNKFYTVALKHFKDAEHINPNLMVKDYLSATLLQLHRFEEAKAKSEEMIVKYPTSPKVTIV